VHNFATTKKQFVCIFMALRFPGPTRWFWGSKAQEAWLRRPKVGDTAASLLIFFEKKQSIVHSSIVSARAAEN
jgi:hypothetical protein